MNPSDLISNTLENSHERPELTRKDKLKAIAKYCGKRLAENNLTDVAGNISFTILLSIVPMLAIVLAVFTTFPEFGSLQNTLETYFSQGMIPASTAHIILNNLTTFAANAANVSIIGGLTLVATALMTISLIESTFNHIWHVMTPRPVVKRIVMYVGIAIFGPLLLGISIYLTSHLVLAAHGLVANLPFLNSVSSSLISIFWTAIAFTLLYRVVPNRLVFWKDAAAGGIFAGIAFEIAIRAFAFFIVNFSTYERIYGALAAFPIFMMWIYISCLIMLLGGMVAALLPEIRNGRWNATPAVGSQFSDAIKIIGVLYRSQGAVFRTEIEMQTHLSIGEVENCLTVFEKTGWSHTVKRSWISTFSFKKRTPQEWRWTGDADSITLADVYHLFVFTGSDADSLTQEVDNLIDYGLEQTLADYFEELKKKEEEKAEEEPATPGMP